MPLAIAAAAALANRRFPGKVLIDGILYLPLVLPPVVLGYLLLVILGTRAPLGGWFVAHLGIRFVFSWTGAAVASALPGRGRRGDLAPLRGAGLDHEDLDVGPAPVAPQLQRHRPPRRARRVDRLGAVARRQFMMSTGVPIGIMLSRCWSAMWRRMQPLEM